MLIGYISDENHSALCGAVVEFRQGDRSWSLTSSPAGALYGDLPEGDYEVIACCGGFGSKRTRVTVAADHPHLFRLLSDGFLGYMWPNWCRSGEMSEYRVHSVDQFRLDLFRYGWNKEFITSYGWCDEHGHRAMMQITPDGDYTRSGVGWNRTGYTLEFQKHGLTAPDRSGLYFLHATTMGGRFTNFPWIVSPTTPTADICVLASTITWNAYNKFGGRSNYFSQDGLTAEPVVNSRQDLGRYLRPDTWPFEETAAPLSFDRPAPACVVPESDTITSPIRGRMGSALAPGEWRLLGWMEREGFEYDLYSETELHFDRVPLESYRVLVLNTHPEYWSPQMYQRVKNWVHNDGGRLMYLAGCGLYAEVEFPDEETMLCRREGEHSLRGENEAHLLGLAYTHSGFQSGAPYRVLDADDPIFAGTGLGDGDLFGHRSLHERCPGGASGHELDKISPDSPANIRHLAKGTNPGDSGADLVSYDTESGGRVFSVGSLCWTLSITIDDGVSAVTANALRGMLE